MKSDILQYARTAGAPEPVVAAAGVRSDEPGVGEQRMIEPHGSRGPSVPQAGAAPATTIILIERRSLLREALARSLRPVVGGAVMSFGSIEDWLQHADATEASVIVLCVGRAGIAEAAREVAQLAQVGRPPVVLLADAETPEQIVGALNKGARGFIPTTVSLDVAVQAMRLVAAGGVFVPASSLIAASLTNPGAGAPMTDAGILFTGRQRAVVEALAKGKSNKMIAYDLTMCESTVKVHVRNIMKKLKARNRTEVAVRVNAMLQARTDENSTRG